MASMGNLRAREQRAFKGHRTSLAELRFRRCSGRLSRSLAPRLIPCPNLSQTGNGSGPRTSHPTLNTLIGAWLSSIGRRVCIGRESLLVTAGKGCGDSSPFDTWMAQASIVHPTARSGATQKPLGLVSLKRPRRNGYWEGP